jgi:hypothetical protein
MISTKKFLHFQEKMSDKPDVVKYIYKCVVCVKKDKGIENDREAMTFIFEENGSLQYKRRQIEKCKGAQQRAVEFIEATGGTVSKPRVFKLGSSDIFSWKCTNSLVLIILLHFATVVHPGVEQRT